MSEKKYFLILNPKGEHLPLGGGRVVQVDPVPVFGGTQRGVIAVNVSDAKRFEKDSSISEITFEKYDLLKKKAGQEKPPAVYSVGSASSGVPPRIAVAVGTVELHTQRTDPNAVQKIVLPEGSRSDESRTFLEEQLKQADAMKKAALSGGNKPSSAKSVESMDESDEVKSDNGKPLFNMVELPPEEDDGGSDTEEEPLEKATKPRGKGGKGKS